MTNLPFSIRRGFATLLSDGSATPPCGDSTRETEATLSCRLHVVSLSTSQVQCIGHREALFQL